jgi:uncharacterized membrane protein YbhN (UPF0104 family)
VQVVVAAGLLVALALWARQLDIPRLGRTFAQASPLPLLAVVLVAFAGIAWKAAFWRFALSELSPVPFWQLLRYAVAATVGSVLAPARAGDAFRIWILRRRHGVPLPLTLTVAGLEKLGDVAALVLLAAPLLWLAPQLPVGWWLIGLSAVALAAVAFVTLIRQRPSFRNWSPLAGLRLFDRRGPVAVALGCVLMAWLFDVVTIELVLGAVGAKPTLSAALTVLLITNLAIAVPVTPGNVGAHELGSAFALKLLGAQAETATAFALLYHGLHTIPVLLAGFVDARRLLGEVTSEPADASSR